MKPRTGSLLLLWLFSFVPLHAQTLTVVQRHAVSWKCHGEVWLENSSLYCKDWQTKEIRKLAYSGQEVFPKLESPPVGSSTKIGAIAEDSGGNIYAVDGTHIHVYTPEGRYRKTFSPGVQLATGIVVIDPEHIIVSGHVPLKSGNNSATIFMVGSNGVYKSFSGPFFSGKSGVEDLVLNTPSILALDRSRGLLYQISQNRYEIRVFDLEGKMLRSISPPAQYLSQAPRVFYTDRGGVGIDPSDTIDDIAVLADGKLAVSGARLEDVKREDNRISPSFSRFLDIYDPTGSFTRRLPEGELQVEGMHLWGIDHRTGKAFLSKGANAVEAAIR